MGGRKVGHPLFQKAAWSTGRVLPTFFTGVFMEGNKRSPEKNESYQVVSEGVPDIEIILNELSLLFKLVLKETDITIRSEE